MENHGKYGELIYSYSGNDLYVNLFIPSKLTWKEKDITVTQQNHFPEEEKTTLLINTAKPVSFALKIRYPSWVADHALKVWCKR